MTRGNLMEGLLLVFITIGACKPSAEELTKRVEAAEAAEKHRAHQATLKREAAEKREQERPKGIDENSSACPMTADRMIKKMTSCGLSMDGISGAKLCSTFGQVKLNFLAARSCAEIEAMLFSK